jgi:adenylate cyclase
MTPTRWAGAAYTYSLDCDNGWTRADVDYEALVLGQADKALRISQDVLMAYSAKAFYLLCTKRGEDARRAAEAGLLINPNFALLHALLGRTSLYFGKFTEAETEVRRAIRLSPRDPALGGWHNLICVEELGLEHLDGSIDECRKAIDADNGAFAYHMNLAAAYALQGKLDEAKTELAEARRLYPELTVKWVIEHYANIPRRNEGLRKAGLPEE